MTLPLRERLKAARREMDAAIDSREFADVPAIELDLKHARTRILDELLEVDDDRRDELVEEIKDELGAARARRRTLESETASRLRDLVLLSWVRQAEEISAPGDSVLRLRSAAIGALTFPTGDPGRLGTLLRALEGLQQKVGTSPLPASLAPDSLRTWIQRGDERLRTARAAAMHSLADALERALVGARRIEGRSVASEVVRVHAKALATALLAVDLEVLRFLAETHRAEELQRMKAIDLLQHPELRSEERPFIEFELRSMGRLPEVGGRDVSSSRLISLEQLLQSRVDQRRSSLRAALVDARNAGLSDQELVPASDERLAALKGADRYRAGAAWVEARADEAEMKLLEERLVRAVAAATGRPELEDAVAELKVRVVGESADSVREALVALERELEAEPSATPPAKKAQTLDEERATILREVHPLAHATWIRLRSWVEKHPGGEVEDVLEEIADEASAIAENWRENA